MGARVNRFCLVLLLGLALSGCSSSLDNLGSSYQVTRIMSFHPLFNEVEGFWLYHDSYSDAYMFEWDSEYDVIDVENVSVCREVKLKCVFSDSFHFAVPKTISVEEKQWAFGGHNFEIIAVDEMVFRGRKKNFYYINGFKSPDDRYLERFVYNEDEGLILFTYVKEKYRNEVHPEFDYPVYRVSYRYDRYGTLDEITSLIP